MLDSGGSVLKGFRNRDVLMMFPFVVGAVAAVESVGSVAHK